MGRVRYYKEGNEITQRLLPVYQHRQDQITKARSLGIKRVSLVDKKVNSFSLAKLYQQRILHYMLL